MKARFSVIIPTLNEANRIEATLRSAARALGGDCELIVCDGGSTDDTVVRARAVGASIITAARSRGAQLDEGFRVAGETICVFVHADTLLPEGAGSAIAKALEPGTVAGGAFRLQFDAPGWRLRMLAKLINARSRLLRTATGDQAIFARRETILRAGGLPRVPLFEDVRLCRKLKQHGKFAILRETVITSPRLWQSAGVGRGVALHLSLRLLHSLGASPNLLTRFYPTVR